MPDTISSTNAGPDDPQRSLASRGFLSLLGISFLGAANDNLVKQTLMLMVVAGGLWAHALGPGTQGLISLVLSVPFLLLSGFAGQVADRYSKQRVIVWVKLAEIPIALVAMAGLLLGSFWLSLLALLLLAVQSAFYGPAKFGVIPDLVKTERLSQANGFINMTTNVAVILGSLAAGPLVDMYLPPQTASQDVIAGVHSMPADDDVTDRATTGPSELVPDPTRGPNRLPIGLAVLTLSVVGFACARTLPRLSAVAPHSKVRWEILRPHLRAIRDADPPLRLVLFAWSGFYLIAAFALLLIPDYRETLGVSNTEITNLNGLLAIAIVLGSGSVSLLSGKTIRPAMAVGGALAMTICFACMGLTPMSYGRLATLIFLIGFSAGFYIVPLQSLLQFLSPGDQRGRFFGTANALSFAFISAAGMLYYLLRLSGLTAAKLPLFCAALALAATCLGLAALRRRLASRWLSPVVTEGIS